MWALAGFFLNKKNWDLFNNYIIDVKRHKQKILETVNEKLPELISDESIVLNNKKRVIKIPLYTLKEYYFRYNPDQMYFCGQGLESYSNKIGQEVINTKKNYAPGEELGLDYYETEVSMHDIEETFISQLKLPNFIKSGSNKMLKKNYYFNYISKSRFNVNIDKKRTILQNLRRRSNKISRNNGNENELNPFIKEDLRFKNWQVKKQLKSTGIVLAMLDISGSMGNYEKYFARVFFYWMIKFLKKQYDNVEIVFLVHHIKADQVSEQDFFSRGESGGTKCSSVYELAINLICSKFLPSEYNIYAFHFSDGDNLPSDNIKCINLMKELANLCNLVGYCEISLRPYKNRTLFDIFSSLGYKHLRTCKVREREDVYTALKCFFSD